MDRDAIKTLQGWYASQCDGDWEHSYGIQIDTLDNPGWMIKVDLTGTPLQAKPYEELKDNYESETDWMRCWIEDSMFQAACGPTRLDDVLQVFAEWSASSNTPIQTDGPSGR